MRGRGAADDTTRICYGRRAGRRSTERVQYTELAGRVLDWTQAGLLPLSPTTDRTGLNRTETAPTEPAFNVIRERLYTCSVYTSSPPPFTVAGGQPQASGNTRLIRSRIAERTRSMDARQGEAEANRFTGV